MGACSSKNQEKSETIKQDYNYWLDYVKNNGIFYNLLTKFRNAKMCEEAVKHSGSSLAYVPDNLKKEEICEIAVKNYADDLQYVPTQLRTEKLCLLAIQKSESSYAFLPEKIKTVKFLIKLIKVNSKIIKLIENDKINTKMCEKAVLSDSNNLAFIPEKFITDKLCLLAVKNGGESLIHVPNEFKTKKLCEIAVNHNGSAIKDVPKEFITKDLCIKASKTNEMSLKYIPQEFLDEALYKLFVNSNGLNLKYVPITLYEENPKLYKEIAILAIKQNHKALEFVEHSNLLEELQPLSEKIKNNYDDWTEALKQDGYKLKDLPEDFINLGLVKTALNNTGEAIDFVPDNLKTEEICELAVEKFGDALAYVPVEKRTKDICLKAIKTWQNESTFWLIPDDLFKNNEFCTDLVNQDIKHLKKLYEKNSSAEIFSCEELIELLNKIPYALYYIPKTLRSVEVCKKAVEKDGMNLKYVPSLILEQYPEKYEEIAKIAIKQNPNSIILVRSYDLYKDLVKKDPNVQLNDIEEKGEYGFHFKKVQDGDHKSFKEVPDEFKTFEMCKLALSKYSKSLEYIPDDIFTKHINEFLEILSDLNSKENMLAYLDVLNSHHIQAADLSQNPMGEISEIIPDEHNYHHG